MQLFAKLSATTLFLQELLNSPRQVGAILPSSPNLAKAMAQWLPADRSGYAIELGPGTGVVTQALLERGLPPERLLAIEMSPKMASLLRKRFPRVKVITGDACELDSLLKRHLPGVASVSAVFSSLPLLNFEPQTAELLASRIHGVLAPQGKFVQYSYRLSRKQAQAEKHFVPVATDVIWCNLPPARVSVYRK